MKIWLDFCEPKSITMLRPLYNRLIKEHEVFITARDFDATYKLLNEWRVPYIKVGKHGGASLSGKLHAYIDRVADLLTIIEAKKPDFLFCITSPEAIRISYGLNIPHVMFYDEPRSVGCSKLTLSMVNWVVVPKPIPIEWYTKYGIDRANILRFNGIDEVGWLNQKDFSPDQTYLHKFNLEPEEYIVFRTIATQSYAHLVDRMKPHETLLTEIIPKLQQIFTTRQIPMKYLIIPRYIEQFNHLAKIFSSEIAEGQMILQKSVEHLADIMYFSKMVISGGGTMVRESALLGVPSIEFIGSDTYPQEQFLIDKGFPLVHVKNSDAIMKQVDKYLQIDAKQDTWDRIDQLENPITIGLQKFHEIVN